MAGHLVSMLHKEPIPAATKYLVCTRGNNMGASIERKLKFMAGSDKLRTISDSSGLQRDCSMRPAVNTKGHYCDFAECR